MQYGAALLAAPLFILLYLFFFQEQPVDLSPFLNDPKRLFFFVLFYPVTEELIFRGMIQEYIALKTKEVSVYYHITLANILTSLLFVAIHFIYNTPLWAILVFVPSLIFGYFKEQYGSVLPSIILHIFYNLCALFIIH